MIKHMQDELAGQATHILEQWASQGHRPGIYYRGDVWRVHRNTATNEWEEHKSLNAAIFALYNRTFVEGTDTKDGTRGPRLATHTIPTYKIGES